MKKIKIKNQLVTISDIAVNDYFLYEEKKIEPDSEMATDKSVGFTPAFLWLFSNFYTCNGEKLTRDVLDKYDFEDIDVLSLINALSSVSADITILDDADKLEDSNKFKYKNYLVERISIKWSETHQFVKIANTNRNKKLNPVETQKKFLKKYFTINGEAITEDFLMDCEKLPIDLFLIISVRLGKFLSISSPSKM